MQIPEAFQKTLVIIPARKGSVGLPGKNKKLLAGQPLFLYSVKLALLLFPAANICLSSDDAEILQKAKEAGLTRLINRPENLSSSDTSMNDVIHHCLDLNPGFEYVLLLQPTSPFRTQIHIIEAFHLLKAKTDGVFSVAESKAIPGFSLFSTDSYGDLLIQKSAYTNRQNAPLNFVLNGAIYWFKTNSFLQFDKLMKLSSVRPYIMDKISSMDIDTDEDWHIAELLFPLGFSNEDSVEK